MSQPGEDASPPQQPKATAASTEPQEGKGTSSTAAAPDTEQLGRAPSDQPQSKQDGDTASPAAAAAAAFSGPPNSKHQKVSFAIPGSRGRSRSRERDAAAASGSSAAAAAAASRVSQLSKRGDDADAKQLDEKEAKLDKEQAAIAEQTGILSASYYSGEWSDEALEKAGFEKSEVEELEFCRKRHPLPKEKWSEAILDEVYSRGCLYTGREVALCYLCEMELKRDQRQCICEHRNECLCQAWEVEHVLAKHVDMTGRHVLGNLLPACVRCNCGTWKGRNTLLELVAKKGLAPAYWAANCSDMLTETKLEIQEAIKIGNEQVDKDAVQKNAELRKQVKAQRLFCNLKLSDLQPSDMDAWPAKLISKGGYGEVYELELKTTADVAPIPVAVKYIKTFTPKFELSFQRELLALATLTGHPTVPKLHGSFQGESGSFMVLELVGTDLHKLSASSLGGSRLNYATIMRDVADALAHMKRNNYIHRDCKPSNILVRESGTRAVLADFGEARQPGDVMSGKAGTAYYRATDMREGVYGWEVDVLAFGKTVEALRRTVKSQLHAHWMDGMMAACLRSDRYNRPLIEQVVAALNFICKEGPDKFTDKERVLQLLKTDPKANKEADLKEREARIKTKTAELEAAKKELNKLQTAQPSPAAAAKPAAAAAAAAAAAVAKPKKKARSCKAILKTGPRKGDTCGRAKPCRYHH